ncbi:CREB-regulated transcription coactivator 1-like [Prunus yedoensis var. nudiflora]|uniref:CREB-regulated transcription coactivator 1-like n=1 Tax=Prunus yedoensis var. nudiflora TaxID=2094558 RepID=A0A314Y4P9_PRUYE|nr:CREB-regulated transcription coactivator 1-like [Prunus yedoensis var. nudiflora]
MPQVQQSQPPATAPYQYYPPAPHLSPTAQLQRLPQLHPPLNAVDPQAQSSLVHNPGETPYMLSQRYPPSMHKPSNATGMALPTQQQYMGSFQYTHDQSTRNHCSDLSAGHMQPVQHSTFDDFYSHEGSPSHNSGSKTKHSQILPASLDRSGGSSISRLPTAQVLPYAIPMASSMDKESSSGVTGNRIPIDNVIDEVVAMGFRRDIVRATVKKMTENGQSVDINVVLDKLMNNGEVQPKSGGFGR